MNTWKFSLATCPEPTIAIPISDAAHADQKSHYKSIYRQKD
jgi:hypothetical protein